LNAINKTHVEFNIQTFIGILPLLLSLALIVGCASDFQSTDSGSSPTYDSSPDTSIQDSIDRTNQQMANDAANTAAQQQFLAGMAAAQETMNNANNNQATSNW
jgi:predicted lipid-binding transport protein (Tim44 family)